ncbi:4290_t:CDS:2 [Entrophospora sp. SA101]|nr:19720_t:CDS:2 [Entrophospora sp. SA101]CAJ0839052.1 19724_t:CDS:2 [Entrophospora sp. SA101]CAJ0897688.1 4290_t:CDS:2 [Entrophospora sp. SA101]
MEEIRKNNSNNSNSNDRTDLVNWMVKCSCNVGSSTTGRNNGLEACTTRSIRQELIELIFKEKELEIKCKELIRVGTLKD